MMFFRHRTNGIFLNEKVRIFKSCTQVGGQCVRTATENKVKREVQFDKLM